MSRVRRQRNTDTRDHGRSQRPDPTRMGSRCCVGSAGASRSDVVVRDTAFTVASLHGKPTVPAVLPARPRRAGGAARRHGSAGRGQELVVACDSLEVADRHRHRGPVRHDDAGGARRVLGRRRGEPAGRRRRRELVARGSRASSWCCAPRSPTTTSASRPPRHHAPRAWSSWGSCLGDLAAPSSPADCASARSRRR